MRLKSRAEGTTSSAEALKQRDAYVASLNGLEPMALEAPGFGTLSDYQVVSRLFLFLTRERELTHY